MKLLTLVFFMLFSVELFAESNGKQLYMQNCMICHSADGSGAMPGVTDLTANLGWSTSMEAQLLDRLKQGIQTPGAAVAMPPKGGNPNLSDMDLKVIISYMRKEFLKK